MPRDVFGADHVFLPRSEILSYEELTRLVGVFASLGVTKVRLTGGEPLLRRDIETLVRAVAATPGITDVAMTSNGSLLGRSAESLAAAGLTRVTVSLDSLDPAVFRAMADTPPCRCLRCSPASRPRGTRGWVRSSSTPSCAGGWNDDGLLDLVSYARDGGHILRFIEFMDVGTTNGWNGADVVPAAELVERVGAAFPLVPRVSRVAGETARRWSYADGRGELGVVASVTAPFCSDCSRARVTAAGELFTCLFASGKLDMRTMLREEGPPTMSCFGPLLVCGRVGATDLVR